MIFVWIYFHFSFSFANYCFSFVLVLQYFFVLVLVICQFVLASYLSVCNFYTAFTPNIKAAVKDVLIVCLNTIHR